MLEISLKNATVAWMRSLRRGKVQGKQSSWNRAEQMPIAIAHQSVIARREQGEQLSQIITGVLIAKSSDVVYAGKWIFGIVANRQDALNDCTSNKRASGFGATQLQFGLGTHLNLSFKIGHPRPPVSDPHALTSSRHDDGFGDRVSILIEPRFHEMVDEKKRPTCSRPRAQLSGPCLRSTVKLESHTKHVGQTETRSDRPSLGVFHSGPEELSVSPRLSPTLASSFV